MEDTPFDYRDATMPFTAAQIATGSNYALQSWQKKEPVDQINVEHPTLDWLVKNKEFASFGNGSFKEPVHASNGSNYQNYQGADQVSYNERDPSRWTDFTYYSNHDGFWFDEDRLIAAGITMVDDADAIPSADEKVALADLLKQSYRGLKAGVQEQMAFELLRDGTQSTKACPGLLAMVSPTPAVGTFGGINAANAAYWRNNASLSIAPANLITQMEDQWKNCRLYGGELPEFIPCGRAFYDTYIAQSVSAIQRHQVVNGQGAATMDPSIDAVNFKGRKLVWDPTFEQLDALLGGSNWTKRAMFLTSKRARLRPVKGHWMRNRRPEGTPDRYVTYFGLTNKYGLTTDKRNALSLMSIA